MLKGSIRAKGKLVGKIGTGIFIPDEVDPTVPSWVKEITQEDIKNWGAKATISDMEQYINENKDELKGEQGPNGEDGYTPIKGKDYFDGVNGTNGKDGIDGISCTHSWNGTILSITSANGTTSANLKGEKGDTGEAGKDGVNGKDGTNGKDGVDGKTPVKGEDYFTEADKQEIVNLVLNELPSSEEVSY